LLDLYRRIRKGSSVRDDEMNPLISTLRLSGIVRTVNGNLKVRNRIYSRVFDRTWIENVMPQAELRRQKAAFRRGIWRTTLVAMLVVTLAAAFTLIAFRQGQARADRRLLYDANMRLAQEAWDHSYVDRVEELLQATAPQSAQEDLRGFEWFLFQQFVQKDVWRWPSIEPYRVIASALSIDGKQLYIGGYQQEANEPNKIVVKLCDIATQRELRTFRVPTDAAFPQVLFSADRKSAIISGPNQTIEQWDLRTGTRSTVLKGHESHLSALALSADGTMIASGDTSRIVKLWDLHKRKEIRTLPKQLNWPQSLALSPNGKMLAIADDSLRVGVWDVQADRKVAQLSSQKGTVTRVAFLPDGDHLLTASKNGTVQFWNIRDKQVVTTLSGHSGHIESIAFSPNGQLLATGSVDRTAKLWSVSSGHELQTFRGHGAAVNSVSFSSNGQYLITGALAFDYSVKIWDIANQPGAIRLPEVQRYLATTFSDANELLAFGINESSQSRLWNLSTGQEVARVDESADDVLCAAFSSDKRLLATGGLSRKVRIHDAATGRLLQLLKGHSGAIYAVAFSPNGELLISGGEDRTLRLWDVATGEEKAQLKSDPESDPDNSYLAVFSPGGEQIASGTREKTVQIWDVASRRVLRTLRGHTGGVRAIAFSSDGKWLATGADDHTLRLWDVSTGRPLRTLGLADKVQRATFSPDGRRLITGGTDGAIRLWDIFSGQELITLPGHTDEVTSITFSRDGNILATSGSDGMIRLWPTVKGPRGTQTIGNIPKF
jgi:WD40 repeat protein